MKKLLLMSLLALTSISFVKADDYDKYLILDGRYGSLKGGQIFPRRDQEDIWRPKLKEYKNYEEYLDKEDLDKGRIPFADKKRWKERLNEIRTKHKDIEFEFIEIE